MTCPKFSPKAVAFTRPLPDRRHFIKTIAFGTASSLLLGQGNRTTVLAENLPRQAAGEGKFSVRISDFPVLGQLFGSIRLSVNPISPGFDPYPDGFFWPVIINRGEGSEFYALDSECQHASCIVDAMDDLEGGMRCRCHGSLYDLDGSVLQGPAFGPLRRYRHLFDGNDVVTVFVPNWSFQTQITPLATQPANNRLKVSFKTFPQVEYELYTRLNVQDSWTKTQFSLTKDGPLDRASFIGPPGEESSATIYADRGNAKGFYAVAMKLLDLT